MRAKKTLLISLLPLIFTSCSHFSNDKTIENEEPTNSVAIINDTESDHLTFKGVPIDGTLKQYITRMEQAGFTYVSNSESNGNPLIPDIIKGKPKEEEPKGGTAILQGDFAGYKGCTVYVSTLEGNDVVSNIVVQFPNRTTWEHLYGDYNNLKEMLTEKYGKPSSVREEFQGYRTSHETDNDKMRKVNNDECKYETRFNTDKGEIILWIGNELVWKTFVCLQYRDNINSNSVKQQAINDL